jgi:hypothetical protein
MIKKIKATIYMPPTLIEKKNKIKSKVAHDYKIATHIKKTKILYIYTIKIKYEIFLQTYAILKENYYIKI